MTDRVMREIVVLGQDKAKRSSKFKVNGKLLVLVERNSVARRDAEAYGIPLNPFWREFECIGCVISVNT